MAIDHPHLDILTLPVRIFFVLNYKGPMAIDHRHLNILTLPTRIFFLPKGLMAHLDILTFPARVFFLFKAPWPLTIPT